MLHIIDDKLVTQNDIDLFFITVKQGKESPGKPADKLSRNEFVEVLVRTAKLKYMEKGLKLKSAPEAVQKLLDDHIAGATVLSQEGRLFRETCLWQLPIDDMMKANLATVKELYSHFLCGINPLTQRKHTDLDIV